MMSLLPRPSSHPLLRLVLLVVGAVALLGGAAWSATAAGFGPAAADDPAEAAAATTPVAEPAPEVKLTGDGLLAWLDVVGALEGLDKIADNAPFGAKKFFEEKTGTDFVPFLRAKIESAVGSGISLTELDAKLDDVDGDGDPTSDVHGLEGVTVDLDVDLAARSTPGAYDVKIALKARAAKDSPLAMNLDGLKINGRNAADALELDLATTLRLDPSAAKKVVVVADQAAVGTVRLGVDGAYDGAENPLAFQVGVLGVRATGTVTADAGVRVTLKDPNGDGVVDLTELASPASLFQASCVSAGARVDLSVTADLAGITGKVGRLTLDDDSLCNGLAAPDVELGDLAQFRSVTLGDVVNGLAQVTQALKSAQAAGDVPVPFVQEPLRDLVAVNEKLVAFFVDNGFTDPANPMASISVDTAETAAVKTLQDLTPRLATALGMSPDALGLKYDAGRVVLTVKTSGDPAARPGTVDLGEILGSVGITEVTGQATASVDPAYALDLGIGFDLAPGKALDQRFFLTNGANGAVATLDAGVTADLDISAVASVLGVRLTDGNAEGPVTLLQRKDPAKPMLSVGLTDPDKDGRTTLAELSAAAALPVTATVNATVPSTTLTAEANAVGVPLGAGTVTLAWPNVPDTTGAGALTVTADQTFLDTALPFTFDTEDPRALISEVLTVTRETITRMRAAVADGNATTTKPLPLVGRSVADLDPVLGKIQGVVDDLIQANDLLTLPALQAKLDEVLATELGSDPAGEIPNIVDLVYEPRTAGSPATVLVKLTLGACSEDRAAGRTGCTVTGDPVEVPFNLDLGPDSRVGGVAGVGADGTVQVGYDARANLTFGVQLPSVTAGAKPTDLPTVSGAPKLFVQDDAALDLGVGAKVNGVISAGLGPVQVSLGRAGEDEPKAQAAVAARFRIATPAPTQERLVVGSPEFTTWLGTLLPKAGSVTVHETESALKATCAGVTAEVDACATLPVYAGSTPLGSVTFTAPDLLTPGGWDVDSTQVEANLKNEGIQFSLLVDGVRTLTHQVSDGLRSLPTGTKIPLVGADVTAGADVLDTFDTEVLGRVQTLSTAVASAATSGAVQTKAQEALAGIPGLPAGQSPTVTVTCRSEDGTSVATCTGTEPIARLQSLEVGLPLSYSKSAGTGKFDIGFPGLRLASDDEVSGRAGLAVQLGFGVDRDLGFYVPTKATNKPEFAVTAAAALPAKVTGDLAFFPIEITDQHAGDDVTVSAGVDLATSRPDGRLPLADLGRAQLTPVLDADANLDLGLRTLKPDGALSALPTFKADLVIDAGVAWSGAPGAKPTTNASIRFDDVAVDAGTLVSDLIKPVAKTLHTYTEPLEKPIEAIKKPIPGVAEAAKLAGKTAPSWYDAFKAADQAANGGKGSSGLQMIDRVISLVELVQKLNKADAPAGLIPLGSFTVLPGVADEPVPLSDADKLIGTSSVTTSNVISKLTIKDVDLGTAKSEGGFSFPAFEKPSSLFGMLLGKDVPLVYFDAGKLEVKRGFQFSYPLGPARLYIGGSAGVSGHLAAGFDTYGLRKAFELVSDDDPTNNGAWSITKGLLQGLYLDDFDQSGKDVPEIKFTASLSAGASVGIPGLEAGAEGGVEGAAEFNLRTDSAGKLRYTHIAEQLKVNKNPLCFFDASAHIDAYIKAFVDTPFGKADYPIVSKRIYEQPDLFAFCRTPQPEEQQNLLADLLEDGTLVLKTDAAPQSITVTQQSATEVEVAAQGIVEVYSPVTKIVADLQGGDDVMDVRYEVPDPTPGDPGDDVPALPATLCGGSGNDRIMVDRGAATLYGDGSPSCPGAVPAGDDSLTSGGGADTVDGGAGSDSIDTGDGADTLKGGAGDDVLRGGLGSDTMDGGSGDDTSDYGDHTQPVTVNLPFPSGQAGEQDRADGVENVYGGGAGDTINLPGGQAVRADGGGGDDTVVTADGTALVMGGEGADHFVGGTGAAQFVGSGGDDVLVDGPGAQTFLGLEGRDTVDYSALDVPVRVVLDGEAGDGPQDAATGLRTDNVVDTDVVIGTPYADELTGGSAAEELRGGAGPDVLEGGPGADLLLGQGGDDDLSGNSGTDRLEGGPGAEVLRGGTERDVVLGEDGDDDLDGQAGDDALDGGAGDDRVRGGEGGDDLHGGAGFDWVDYSDRTDDLKVSIDDVAYDGAGFGSEKDNLHTDVEKYVGGSGRDEVHGSTHDQVFLGNDGNDYLAGMGGADRFEGGAGNDRLFDLEFNRWGEKGGDGVLVDTFVGGDGNDEAYGNGGQDQFDMGAGDDDVVAGRDVDTVHLGDGDDDVYAGAGADLVYGEGGDDLLRGEDGDDQLDSGPSVDGNGAIWGGLGSDTIWNGRGGGAVTTGSGGGTADDAGATNTVYGYASPAGSHNPYNGSLGTDVYHLGDGYDIVSDPAGDDYIDVGDGGSTVNAYLGDDTIVAGTGKDQLSGGQGDDVIEGGDDDDNLYGNEGDDVLRGGAGDDGLNGYEGDDLLDGGDDADRFEGGTGSDTVTYAGRTTPVVVSEDGNFNDGGVEDLSAHASNPNGRDHVVDNVEVVIGGSAADHLWLADKDRVLPATLVGGDGADVLEVRAPALQDTTFVGGPGDDELIGGPGDDTFDQGAAPDGADGVTGGDGADAVDYSHRPAGAARVSLDDVANDGQRGEGDNVHADVETSPGATGGEQPPVGVTVAAVRVSEGAATARFTVTLSEPDATPTTLPWSLASGTATVGKDVRAGSGTVTVPAGQTTATFDVAVLADALDEADETATVTVGTAKATLTVVDDDAAPRLVVRPATVVEGKKGTRTMTFQVVLSAVSGKTVSVRLATANGTARAGSDYLAKTQVVTFAPGQTVRTFTVTVKGDRAKEKNETLKVVPSAPVNVTLGSPALGTIRNDDK